MKKIVKIAAIPVLLAVSSFASAGAKVVDLFDGAPLGAAIQSVSDDVNGAGPVQAAEFGPLASILGGYRDISVDCLSGCTPGASDASASITNIGGEGLFNFGTDSGVDGQAVITWDGAGTGLAATGLGGVDISGFESFEVDVLSSDGGLDENDFWQFAVFMRDTAGNESTVTLIANKIIPPGAVNYISLDLFSQCGGPYADPLVVSVVCSGGTIDLTQLDILQARLNVSGTTDIDLRLRGVQLVPEPGMVSMMGLGLLLMGLFARRKNIEV